MPKHLLFGWGRHRLGGHAMRISLRVQDEVGEIYQIPAGAGWEHTKNFNSHRTQMSKQSEAPCNIATNIAKNILHGFCCLFTTVFYYLQVGDIRATITMNIKTPKLYMIRLKQSTAQLLVWNMLGKICHTTTLCNSHFYTASSVAAVILTLNSWANVMSLTVKFVTSPSGEYCNHIETDLAMCQPCWRPTTQWLDISP